MIHIVAKDIPFRSDACLADQFICFFVDGAKNVEETNVPILTD